MSFKLATGGYNKNNDEKNTNFDEELELLSAEEDGLLKQEQLQF